MEITTKRLTIRPVQIGDEKEIHKYAGDKNLTMMTAFRQMIQENAKTLYGNVEKNENAA